MTLFQIHWQKNRMKGPTEFIEERDLEGNR